MRNRKFTKFKGEGTTICIRVEEIEVISFDSDSIIINTSSGLEIHVIITDSQTNEKVVDDILNGYDIVVSAIYRK